jgi:pimeloyl-ACP methyl ester carboxylesterase
VSRSADVIVPDLRGFGESDKHPADPAREYNAAAGTGPATTSQH